MRLSDYGREILVLALCMPFICGCCTLFSVGEFSNGAGTGLAIMVAILLLMGFWALVE